MLYAIIGLVDPGRRGDRPRPGLPDLRVDHPLRRRNARPHPDPDGERLPPRRRRARVAHHAADAAARDQLAGKPDRRRADARRPRARSPSSRSATTSSSSPTRSTAGSCTTARSTCRSPRCRHGRADDRPRRLLEDLRDDRLATGLRDRAAVARRRRTASSSSTRSACAATFAQVGRDRGAARSQDDVDAMVVEFRARRDLIVDGLNAIPGIRCRRPQRRVLRLPGHLRHRAVRRRAGRAAAPRGRRVRPRRAPRSVASGTDHIRISYANSRENLTEALARIRSFVEPSRAARPAARRPSAGLRRAGASPTTGWRPIRERATRTSGRTSCHRRATSCCARRRGCDGVLTLLTDRVDDEFLDAAGPRAARSSATSRSATTTSTSRRARARGIPVGNTPGVLTETTADLAWALLDGRRPARRRRATATFATGDGRRGARCCCWAPTSTARRSASSGSGGSGRRSRGARRASGCGPLPRRRRRRRRTSRPALGATYVPLEDAAARRATSSRSTSTSPGDARLIERGSARAG